MRHRTDNPANPPGRPPAAPLSHWRRPLLVLSTAFALLCLAFAAFGTTVILSGASGTGTQAVVWSGCGSVNGEGKCVSLTANRRVTTTFKLLYQLSVGKAVSGSGTVTSSPAGIECGSTCSASFDHGTTISLTVLAAPGSRFKGWSGCDSTADGTCTVTMSAAKTVSAGFARQSHRNNTSASWIVGWLRRAF